MAAHWGTGMSWDAGRKTNAASFTVVPPSTPASPQNTTTAVPLSLSGLRDDFINWFFGFPGSLIAQRLRHYHWGRYVGQYNPDYSKTFLYQKPSTEEFYQSAQTQQPLDFVSLSGYQKNDSNSGENIFCGVDKNGTLWTWGLLETAFAVSNPFGTGENADFPVGVKIGLFSAYGAFTGQANKLRTVTPQPVYGENDDLSGVVFTKAVAGTECVVALTSSGSLYCSGNGGFVFGFGDYYTNDLLSRSPKTEMLGNQIDYYINNSSQPQRGAILVLMLSVLLLIGLSWYLRSTAKIGKEQMR